MTNEREYEVGVLKLTLHGRLVGYLAGFQSGRNVVTIADEYRNDDHRPTLSLTTHPEFPNARKLLSAPWMTNQRLHPVLSNLLPEGALRELLARSLKVHIDREFPMFSFLGEDLPGALIARAMEPEEIPETILGAHGRARPVKAWVEQHGNRFSLAGVQMKFSMKEREGRYNLPRDQGASGEWIVKPPSVHHGEVPTNEYTAMTLASLAGVEIPEIRLVEKEKLDNLSRIQLPDEGLAFAIKRFDRESGARIHMEDFAQVFVKYPHEKYDSASYEQLGRVLYRFSADGLADVQQLARRLLVNILLANGDAHLKNWSLLYRDRVTPRLSPAYDIVTTSVYIENEKHYALNLGKTKEWYRVEISHFEAWAKKAGIPWRAIKPHLDDTMERARSLWPKALEALPMDESHKRHLKAHWRSLRNDFRIMS